MNTPPQSTSNTRHNAVRIISDFIETQSYPDRALDQIRDHRAQVMQLTYGVLRHLAELRWIIQNYSKQPPRPRIEACLLCALYEMLFMDNTEDHGTVHDTVNIARNVGSDHDASYVNAVLRRAQRERNELLDQLTLLPEQIQLEHPKQLLTRWNKQYESEKAKQLCTWNNTPSFATIRPIQTRISFNEYLHQLCDNGIQAKPHPFLPEEFIILPHGSPIHRLPGYADGLFTVQDPATSVAVQLLAPQPGETILDACAAPGGKTMLIAEAMNNKGILLANDLYTVRLKQLQQNIRRLGWTNVHISEGDASAIDKIPSAKTAAPRGFDGILIDVPCSNTGVIRRRPDIRWRFSKTRLKKILKAQVEILYSAAQNIKKGGRLVYSTCSIEPEENHDQIQRWINNNPEYTLEETKFLFPTDTQTDGAFAARIIRNT